MMGIKNDNFINNFGWQFYRWPDVHVSVSRNIHLTFCYPFTQ